ncbi:MAG: GntR family transcriptional regulator [Bacillota bacterium]|nr:GntR family transcriptional regulator [Bacillota bacterium]
MHIILNQSSMIPIYEQLVDQIKNKIIEGELKEGDALPSVRAFSNQLKISALTVKKAYDKLEEDGFVRTVHGKGTFVLEADHNLAKEARFKRIEDELVEVIEHAKMVQMTKEEIKEMMELLLEETL